MRDDEDGNLLINVKRLQLNTNKSTNCIIKKECTSINNDVHPKSWTKNLGFGAAPLKLE